MFDLLTNYFQHIPFVVVHVLLFFAVVRWTLLSLARTRAERDTLEEWRRALDAEYGTDSSEAPDTEGPLNKKWNDFLRRVSLKRKTLVLAYTNRGEGLAAVGNQVNAEEMAESYRNDRTGEIEWLERAANLFLLSGVAGTLVVLFTSLSQGTADQSMLSQLAQNGFRSLAAFSITVVAVTLAAATHVMDMIAQANINHTAELLRVGLGRLKSARRFKESIDTVLADLSVAVQRLDATLQAPETVLQSLGKVHDELAGIRTDLDKTAQHLNSVVTLVKTLPDDVKNSYDNSVKTVQEAMARLASGFDSTVAQTKNAFSTIEDAVTRVPDQLRAVLDERDGSFRNALGSHEQFTRDFFTKQQEQFVEVTRDLQRRSQEFASSSQESLARVQGVRDHVTAYATSVTNAVQEVQPKFLEFGRTLDSTMREVNGSLRKTGMAIEELSHAAYRSSLQAGGPGFESTTQGSTTRKWVVIGLVITLVAGLLVAGGVILRQRVVDSLGDSSEEVEPARGSPRPQGNVFPVPLVETASREA